jgi:4-alpha-glucanotransferase
VGSAYAKDRAQMTRVSGVTIPLFSLRTRNDWGIGQITDLPACAAWLQQAGQRLVQVLPTHELSEGETSPYGALSAFAIDPIYIDVEAIPDLDGEAIAKRLGEEGLAELDRVRRSQAVDYETVRHLKKRAFAEAFSRFREKEIEGGNGGERAHAFFAFIEREGAWLRDHALYIALRHSHDNHGWSTWPQEERDREHNILMLANARRDDGGIGTRVLEQMYLQWIAHEQWHAARAGLKKLNVALMGDMPFIVGGESADVWAHRDQFRTDVSLGAPPDEFAKGGQSWGLPAYDWAAMDTDGLAWLRMRAKHASALYDRFRIDHLVGFFRQWVQKEGAAGEFVPPDEKSQRARGEKVLRALIDAAGPGAVIAEDLGVIPPFVRETMARLGLPGYKVLPWEKDERFIPRDPRSFPELSVATWSTHDTQPITAWWDDLETWERERLAALDEIPLDLPEGARELALLKLLFSARSELTLVLVNELLGDKSRINTPGTVNDKNWTWRLPRPIEDLAEDPKVVERFAAIRSLVAASGRL